MGAPVAMTQIYYDEALRQAWPRPLAKQWAEQYPQLFDADDLRLTVRQPNNHFAEWFAAIHLFHRDGVLALVEKYIYATHPAKRRQVLQIQDGLLETLQDIRRSFKVQPPDLLLYSPRRGLCGFAEAKGIPGDRRQPSAKQSESHRVIKQRLGVDVELLTVRRFRP